MTTKRIKHKLKKKTTSLKPWRVIFVINQKKKAKNRKKVKTKLENRMRKIRLKKMV
jgi:hypothetical protein